jgi:hypothetical protein
MSEFDQPEIPVSQYGAQRRAAWLAGLQANSDIATAAEMAAHAPESAYLRRGQAGIMGMPGEQQAATLAALAPTVGTGTDSPRQIERLGGVHDHHIASPHPPARDLTRVGQPGHQPGEQMSPLARYMRGEH